jgi:hypothetical protein
LVALAPATSFVAAQNEPDFGQPNLSGVFTQRPKRSRVSLIRHFHSITLRRPARVLTDQQNARLRIAQSGHILVLIARQVLIVLLSAAVARNDRGKFLHPIRQGAFLTINPDNLCLITDFSDIEAATRSPGWEGRGGAVTVTEDAG